MFQGGLNRSTKPLEVGWLDDHLPGCVLCISLCCRRALTHTHTHTQVKRVGPSHQAGSDSLVTSLTFFKMARLFFENNIDESKYSGVLYGLGQVKMCPVSVSVYECTGTRSEDARIQICLHVHASMSVYRGVIWYGTPPSLGLTAMLTSRAAACVAGCLRFVSAFM